MQGDEASSLVFLSPVRDPSTPALCIALGLFLKPFDREKGYTSQLLQHMSPIYKEPPQC